MYEVFPDRFASSGLDVDAARVGDHARTGTSFRADVGPTRPSSGSAATCVGVEERLDHLSSLGVNVLYLTPVFPAGSTHRYDATTFDACRPAARGRRRLRIARSRGACAGDPRARRPHDEPRRLGARVVRRRAGAARARARVLLLRRVLRARLRVLVRRARHCRSSTTDREELRERMYGGSTSVVRRWLEPPYDLDGWRIDVANMTGRLGATDHLLEVASGVRSAAVGGEAGRARRRRARARRTRRSARSAPGTAR